MAWYCNTTLLKIEKIDRVCSVSAFKCLRKTRGNILFIKKEAFCEILFHSGSDSKHSQITKQCSDITPTKHPAVNFSVCFIVRD